ncbi:hypothetical protein BDP27DRAFT_1370012 [Rhodocollybia butyracea]|uniref:Uncharacterized protein n=1 Tax=Rhodocollybia butyracea TaxID=206335 RepID=A0A9P5P9Y9_9AGAR|nr:hypothetical protein BDP27DRAFT_1370012 [Rhodocollybia butyracea]
MNFHRYVSELPAGQTDELQRRTVSDSPFGQMQNPAAKHLKELSTLISHCRSTDVLSASNDITTNSAQVFGPLLQQQKRNFYQQSQLRLERIAWLGGSSLLSPHHREELYRLPLSAREPTILRNLYHLRQYFPKIISSTEIALFHILDAYPDETSETLRWCSKSLKTLGLGTWFACKFLFQDTQCVHAKTGTLTSEDELGMQKWCRTAEICMEKNLIITNYKESMKVAPRMLESAQVSPIGAMNDGGYRRWPSAKGVGKKDSLNSNDNDAGGMRPVENVVGKFKFMGCIILEEPCEAESWEEGEGVSLIPA